MGTDQLSCTGGRGARGGGLKWPPGNSGVLEGAERLHERRDVVGRSPLPEPGTPATGSAALSPRAGWVAASTHDP